MKHKPKNQIAQADIKDPRGRWSNKHKEQHETLNKTINEGLDTYCEQVNKFNPKKLIQTIEEIKRGEEILRMQKIILPNEMQFRIAELGDIFDKIKKVFDEFDKRCEETTYKKMRKAKKIK